MNYQVVTKTVSAQPVAAVRRRALSRDVGRIWKPALDLVTKDLNSLEAGLSRTGDLPPATAMSFRLPSGGTHSCLSALALYSSSIHPFPSW